jgi:hypothetical protein
MVSHGQNVTFGEMRASRPRCHPASVGCDETICPPGETILATQRSRPETMTGNHPLTERRGSVMCKIFNLIYRWYCRARLMEMRHGRSVVAV